MFCFKYTIQQAACKFSASCSNSCLQEGDVKYVIFLFRNKCGTESSPSSNYFPLILSYTLDKDGMIHGYTLANSVFGVKCISSRGYINPAFLLIKYYSIPKVHDLHAVCDNLLCLVFGPNNSYNEKTSIVSSKASCIH